MLDVGGGLGIDYDGTQSNTYSSMNYTVEEYANNVVSIIREVCREENIEEPELLSESGRFLVAHHALMLIKPLGTNTVKNIPIPSKEKEEHEVIQSLRHCLKKLDQNNVKESLHNAQILKDNALSLFDLGYLDLKERYASEALTSAEMPVNAFL